MKRLLAVLLAAAIALPVAADTQVVCTITAQSNTACSAITVSEAARLDPCRCSANGGGGGAEPSVYDDAIALWKLDETSGTRADSIGSLDLTDNNTVGYQNLGPSGTVASFVSASNEYLSRADAGQFDIGVTGKTWAAWVRPGTAGTNRAILSQRTAGDGAYQLYVDTSNNIHAYVADSSSGFSEPVGSALTADSWYFVVMWYDPADKKLRISVDDQTAAAGAALTNGPVQVNQDFNVGRLAASIYSDIQLGRVGMWDGVLPSSERTSLYNSGVGKQYADLTAAEKVGLVSYWNLDEASGNRADSHGSNTLTDNNTVGSTTNSYPANLPDTVASFVAANSEYLSLASDSTLDLNGGDYTYAFWVNFTSLPGELYPLGRDTAGSLTQYFFNSTASSVTFNIQDDPFSGAMTASTGGGSVSTGTWYLVVAGREGSNVFISLNGGAKSTAAITITPATGAATFFLGARRAAYGHMNGLISAAAVWDRALSADDITALYNSGDGAVLP